MRVLCALLFLAVAANAASWVRDSNVSATLLMGISFPSEAQGYIAGGSNGIGPFILGTTDGGMSWNKLAMATDILFVMALKMSTATQGVASGLALIANANQYTTDGKNFVRSSGDDLVTTCQSAERVLGTSTGFGLTGSFGKVNGVAVTQDGGRSFKKINFQGNTDARYGAFPSSKIWYVAGGTWPNTSSSEGHQINQFLSVKPSGETQIHYHEDIIAKKSNLRDDNDSWVATVMKTTDGGSTWTRVFHDEGRFYPNEISCADVDNCWFVVEGNGGDFNGAAIYGTTDGGSTWTQQHYGDLESMMTIQMLSVTEGWVGGAYVPSQFGTVGRFYHTTDGGNTWNLDSTFKGVMPTGIEFLSDSSAWATAITIEQTSTLLRYS